MTQTTQPHHGILLFDKPVGWSSHRVVATVRRATQVKRVGHTGTLDPFASGLLIVLVGREFTRLQDHYLKLDKSYQCSFELGYETTTLDVTGAVIAQSPPSNLIHITQSDLVAVLQQLQGTYHQTPPAFAAIKQQGVKLYQTARSLLHSSANSEAFTTWSEQLPSRLITVSRISLEKFTPGTDTQYPQATITVWCESGTYIRALVRDIGRLLHTQATATVLKRLSIAHYQLDQANQIQQPIDQWQWLSQELSEKPTPSKTSGN